MHRTSELSEKPKESTWLRLSTAKEPRVVNRSDHSLTWDADLSKTLCRPLNHSWRTPPFFRAGSWSPEISEYREAQCNLELTCSTQKLLSTRHLIAEKCPVQYKHLMTFLSFREKTTEAVSLERPSTTKRQSGRIPVMVFQSKESVESNDETPFNVSEVSILSNALFSRL